jgi:serine/threonine-protein kinase
MSLVLQEGNVFANRYRIVRCIALGGMGAVYEVVHIETERRRALKVMLPHILESAELRERFKREARVAAQIESEFIVDVFDAGVDEITEMPFLVMELLRGEEIGKRLTRVGRLTPTEVVSWLYQTALALDKTHKASIVHRDLKPENLFLTHREHGEPSIKVLDFGIAKFVAEHATNANATRSIGTPVYMAPEQFRTGKITPAVDIYALGMIAYTLLVGIPYWEPELNTVDNVFAFGVIAMAGPKEPAVERAATFGVKLPAAFDAWFAQVTAADPSQRFARATLAIEALAEVLGVGQLLTSTMVSSSSLLPAVSVPPGTLAQTGTQGSISGWLARRRGPSFAVGLAVGVLAVAGVALALVRMRDTPPAPGTEVPVAPAPAPALATTEPTSAQAPSESAAVQVSPAPSGSAAPAEGAAPAASPSVRAGSRPSSAPGAGTRRPPHGGRGAPAPGKSAEPDGIYSRD